MNCPDNFGADYIFEICYRNFHRMNYCVIMIVGSYLNQAVLSENVHRGDEELETLNFMTLEDIDVNIFLEIFRNFDH